RLTRSFRRARIYASPARISSSRGRCHGLHQIFHHVIAYLKSHLRPDEIRDAIREAGPDAGTCDLFSEGRDVGPAVDDAGSRGAGHRDLGDVHGSEHRLDDARDAAALDAMGTWIFRVHRRRGDRLPRWLTLSRRVA